jgi:hypothetical protein
VEQAVGELMHQGLDRLQRLDVGTHRYATRPQIAVAVLRSASISHDLEARIDRLADERIPQRLGAVSVQQPRRDRVEVLDRFALRLRDVKDVGDPEPCSLLSARASPLSSSLSFMRYRHGAKMAIPFSPFLTERPIDFHVRKPATSVAT